MATQKSMGKGTKFRLGALVDVVAYTAFWMSLVNFCLIALTAYNTTIRVYIIGLFPWFNVGWFFLLMVIIVLSIMALEYFFLFPARQHFRNQWEYRQDSPIRKDLEEIKKQLRELQER